MNRRHFLAGALATGLPFRARAQTSILRPLVGWLGLASEGGDRRMLAALREGLGLLGYHEGRNISLVRRHADGRMDRLASLIADMEALEPDVFLAAGRAVAREMVKVTKRPIVAVRLPAGDMALYASLARPGGNLTGFSNFSEELAPKRIQILRDIMPDLSRVGVMHGGSVQQGGFDFGAEAETAARAAGLDVVRLAMTSPAPQAVGALIRSLKPSGIRALLVVQDFVTITAREDITNVALQEGIATMTDEREFAEQGALVSYGADVPDLFRRSASYVERILKGANPGELPIQLATKFELVLNLKTAKAMGLSLPPSLLARADEVIE